MYHLKPLHRDAIPRALEKAERYRVLNDPLAAESICLDILDAEPHHQEALRVLVLALTDQFENGRALLVTGRAENEEGRVRITADDVMILDDARERKAQAVQVRLEDADLDDAVIRRLRRALEGSPGELPVYLELVRPGRFRLVARTEPSLRVGPSPKLVDGVESVLGPGRLRYRARVMSR